MFSVTNEPYTPEIVRNIFKVLPQLLAARDSGTLNIDTAPAEKASIEDKLAIEVCNNLMPRASRRCNTVYQIDNVAAVLADISRAIKACLDRQQNIRITRHYYLQWTLEEIADAEGVSAMAISKSIDRSITRMAKFLELPAEIKPRTYFGDAANDTHHEKYRNPTHTLVRNT